MFKGSTDSSLSSEQDIFDYVEDYDIFNSKFIFSLEKNKTFRTIEITNYEKRLDLINQYLAYKDKGKYGLLGVDNRIFSHLDLFNGNYINVISEGVLENLKSEGM